MASPPAKRQRRSRQLSDDDESEYDDTTVAVPVSTQSKSKSKAALKRPSKSVLAVQSAPAKSPRRRVPSRPTPKASPSPSKKAAKGAREPEKSKSLHSFFGRATEDQRWNKKQDVPDQEIEDGELGDAIVDDDSHEDSLSELVGRNNPIRTVLDRRKVFASTPNSLSKSHNETPPPSQRFVKPELHQKKAFQISEDLPEKIHRPWSDRYGPANLEELAVHKKKVADVQKWLTDALGGFDERKLLVLKGPAGSGKSTTVALLSKLLDAPLIPWINPTAAELGSSSTVAAQFNDFLNRSGQYGSLDFDGLITTESASTKRILVIEEFPTNMTRSSAAIDSFRSVVLQYIASGASAMSGTFRRHSLETHPPVIMVVTETLLTSNTAATDSFTAHRLFGPEICNHPLVTIIEFNPVAPTFVTKALDLVIKKEARDSKRRRAPGPAVIQRLADIGDIRSAVNSLEFLCVRGDYNSDWSGTVAAKGKRTGKDSIPLTGMERQSLELISQRETTLYMFHAVGKVVHNKRDDPTIKSPQMEHPPKPPDHLSHFKRPKISQVDVEALLNETGTDIQTFLSTVHENYVLSCNGDLFVDIFADCSHFLSDSDILNPDSRSLTRSSRYGVGTGIPALQSGGTDILRQDEISFQVATRGILFSLPSPVSRVGGASRNSFQMFYPASLRLWKPTEEVESLISLFIAQGYEASNHSSKQTSNTSLGVAAWQRRAQAQSASLTILHQSHHSEEPTTFPPTRAALTLTQFPYMAKLKPGNRMLARITQYHGLSADISSADEPFDNDEPDVPPPLPSMLARLTHPSSSITGGVRNMPPPPKPANISPVKRNLKQSDYEMNQLEKLYISDDDIQDDDE